MIYVSAQSWKNRFLLTELLVADDALHFGWLVSYRFDSRRFISDKHWETRSAEMQTSTNYGSSELGPKANSHAFLFTTKSELKQSAPLAMKNREQILMQKITRREKVKKQLKDKTVKAVVYDGKKILWNVPCEYSKTLFVESNSSKPKGDHVKKRKLIEKPDKKVKKKKKVAEPESEESDEEMEEASDDEDECKYWRSI